MREFTKMDIDNYTTYVNENILELNKITGCCFICGEHLNKLVLPVGPERQVTCLDCREYFIDNYDELLKLELRKKLLLNNK